MARRSLTTATREEIERLIEGSLGEGDLLPPEGTLAEQFQVSRSTVREAIGSLVSEGVVERKWGVGTRVLPPKKAQPVSVGITRMAPAWDGIRQAGLTPGIASFRLERGKADEELSTELGVEVGAPLWLVWRTITADDNPTVHVHDLIPMSTLPHEQDVIRLASVEHHIIDALGGAAKGITTEGSLTATVSDDATSANLGVEVGHPLLRARFTVLDGDRNRLSLHVAHYRTDLVRVRFSAF